MRIEITRNALGGIAASSVTIDFDEGVPVTATVETPLGDLIVVETRPEDVE